MARRAMLNCWLVAMWLWIQFRGHGWAGVRRSHSFKGLIPHFGYAERTGFRRYRSIEYIPPKSRLWTSEDMALIFSGRYVVVHYKAIAVHTWVTKEQALADYYFHGDSNGRA
ncbi:MAG: hypothetical protein KA507_02935 [Candidatus Accumulibacter sp.]|nr:hypothetical protein [Accumulibacter sp.]